MREFRVRIVNVREKSWLERVLDEIHRSVPDDVWATMPTDFAARRCMCGCGGKK